MSISQGIRSLLDKAAIDNGFAIQKDMDGPWLCFEAMAAPARVCLTQTDSGFAVGTDHVGAAHEMGETGIHSAPPTPPSGFVAFAAPDLRSVNLLVAQVYRLSRSLPTEPLREFEKRLKEEPPSTTEIERLRKERVGQDVFRKALMLYWNEQCAVTGVSHPNLLRASHIIPWAICEDDAERLNVMNGLLLASHLDAAFDTGLISFDNAGQIILSPELTSHDREKLGISETMRLTRISEDHIKRLAWHRENVFKPN